MEMFEALPEEERTSLIAKALESDYSSLAITLTTGDTLYGDISLDIIYQYKEFSKKHQESPEWAEFQGKPICDKIQLLFPDGSGTIFGRSYVVNIPVNQVANIQQIAPVITIDEKNELMEGHRKLLRNSPNPFSTSIKNHNMSIIEKLNFEYYTHLECALSSEALLGAGIMFHGFELIYSDWYYFKIKSGGIRSIGAAILGSVGWEKSLYNFMLKKLQDEKYINHLLDEHPEYNIEVKVSGFIHKDSKEQSTVIEGENCNLYELTTNKESPIYLKYKTLPIFTKEKYFEYPEDYLLNITSILTVYGELKQIPVILNERQFPFSIIARSIAYIPLE